MSTPKAQVKQFLDNAYKITEFHFKNSVNAGELTREQANQGLENFRERSEMLLSVFNRPSVGGALPQMPSAQNLQTSLAAAQAFDPEAEIKKIMEFSPSQFIPDNLKPFVDKNLWIFVPEVRENVKKLIGSVFVLGSLDKIPVIGPYAASALDITTAYLPTLAVTIQNMLPNLVGLAPIPYAAYAGEAAGYAFSAMFLFLNAMINFSKAEFEEMFESLAGLVPVFGTTLMEYVKTFTDTYKKIAKRRDEILQSFTQLRALVTYLLGRLTGPLKPVVENTLGVFQKIGSIAAQSTSFFKDFSRGFFSSIKNAADEQLKRLNTRKQLGGVRKRRSRKTFTRGRKGRMSRPLRSTR